jgi:hypothetical protein
MPPRPSIIVDKKRTLGALNINDYAEYYGEVADGKEDGEGMMYSYGLLGEGELLHAYFINGEKHMGIEVVDSVSEVEIYRGQWTENCSIEGLAEWWHIDGRFYKGEWNNGCKNG